MSRPLKENSPDEESGHDHRPDDRRATSSEEHVESQDQNRKHRPGPLDRSPPESKTHQQGPQQNIQHHPNEEDVKAGYGKEVHEPRLGEAFALGVRHATPIPQEKGPQNGPSSSAGDVPVDLATDMLPDNDEGVLPPSTPISLDIDVVRLSDIHRTANPSPGQVRTIIKPTRVSESRCRPENAPEPQIISLPDLGEGVNTLGPRGRPERDASAAIHRGRTPASKEGINLQSKARCLLGPLGSIHHNPLEGRRLVALFDGRRQGPRRRTPVHGVPRASQEPHSQHNGHNPSEGRESDEPRLVPPLNA